MANLPPDHTLNLTASQYRHVENDPRSSFVSFQSPPPEMSPQAAMAAALAAAQSSAVAADVSHQPDFSRGQINPLDPSTDPLAMRLSNMDIPMHRQHRPIIPTYSVNVSVPIPSSLPPVQQTANVHPSASPQLAGLSAPYSHPLSISHLTSDRLPYARPPKIPPMSYPTLSTAIPATKPSDQGIIPAAAQLIDTSASRGRARSGTGAVRKKATTTRRRKARTGPATFVCALVGCGKAFRMHGDLQTHMRKHTGDEPFVCSFPDCEMRYKWRSSLSHHEGLHRKAKDFRLKPRRRRRSTATMIIPPEQLVQNVNGTYTDPQASMVSAGQTNLVMPNGQANLVGTATPSSLVSAANQAGLVGATTISRLS